MYYNPKTNCGPDYVNGQLNTEQCTHIDNMPDLAKQWFYRPARKGYEWKCLNGKWPEEVLITPLPITGLANQKLQSINTIADAILEPITSTYPKTEVVSWDKQEVEARRWQDWKTASSEAPEPPTQLIDNILATRTDITKPELVQRIIAKADSYAFSGQIFGIRHNLEKQLDAILADNTLTDDEKRTAIEAIDERQAYSVVKR